MCYLITTHAARNAQVAASFVWAYQVDIRMRSHRLLRLNDNTSAASCKQACCKLIVRPTFYPKAAKSLIFTELLQLDEVNKLAATC